MIALRRAPGAKSKDPRPPRPAKPPRERRHRLRALRARLARSTRPMLAPAALRKRELIAVTALAVAAVLALAGIAAVISYSHMFDWARANHEPDWRARLFPLSVDGAILAASMVLYADSRAGRRADKLAYLITLSGFAWSVGANIGHTWVDSLAAKMIAGWPPIAMFLSVELMFRFARRWRGQADAEVRKAERKAVKLPVPAPAAEVAVEVPAPRPEPAPLPQPSTGERPAWFVEGSAKDSCMAYLTANPAADAKELDAAVGKYIRMSDGYARRMVRQFNGPVNLVKEA
jgi:Protein of unknown function (DUF2637)